MAEAEEIKNPKSNADLFSDEIPAQEPNPLFEPVINKSYSEINVGEAPPEPTKPAKPAPSPKQEPKAKPVESTSESAYDRLKRKREQAASAGNSTPPPPSQPGTFPPETGQPKEFVPNPAATPVNAPAAGAGAVPAMTPEEERRSAGQMADLILSGYDKIHGVVRFFGKTSVEGLLQEHVTGKIDMDYNLPLGSDGDMVPLRQFIVDCNAMIDKDIVVTQEFRDKVRPKLVRICIKKKWFLSDELSLALDFGEDIATKGALMFSIKSSMGMVLDSVRTVILNQRKREEAEKKRQKEEMEKREEARKEEEVRKGNIQDVEPEPEPPSGHRTKTWENTVTD